MEKRCKRNRNKRKLSLRHGGKSSVKIQHEKEENFKERFDIILDNNSFDEIGKISGSSSYNDDGELEDFTQETFYWV